VAAGVRGDEQDAQDGGVRCVRCRHAQHAADPAAVQLGDPATEPRVGRGGGEVGHDARHQRVVRHVPAERRGVDLAVLPDHPAQVAGLVGGSDDDTHLRTSY
jgi:hypothetical protein